MSAAGDEVRKLAIAANCGPGDSVGDLIEGLIGMHENTQAAVSQCIARLDGVVIPALSERQLQVALGRALAVALVEQTKPGLTKWESWTIYSLAAVGAASIIIGVSWWVTVPG